MTVHVLSTMEFGQEWLRALAGDDGRVEILEIPAERADELPGVVLCEVEVMYTSLAFPTPKQAPRLCWVQLEERYRRMRREAEDEEPLDPDIFDRSTGDQEELIDILRSIMFDERRISSVNVPNTGYVPNLPQGAVLEIPGVATARGLRPVGVPDFPDTLAAIVDRRLASVTLTIEASLRGDRDLVVEALLADGAVHDPDTAADLANSYIATQSQYLPWFA